MKNYVNLPNLLLVSLLVKGLGFGFSLPESICVLGFVAMSTFFHYLEFKKEPEINEVLKKEHIAMKEQIRELQSTLSSIKLGNNFLQQRR